MAYEMKNTSGAVPDEAAALSAEVFRAFEEFKAASNERLAQIEKKGAADPLTDGKIDRINAAITALEKKSDAAFVKLSRPNVGAAPDETQAAYLSDFKGYMRGRQSPDFEAKMAAAYSDRKAMLAGVTGDGGALVPDAAVAEIERIMAKLTPMRALARVQQIGGASYKKIINKGGSTSGWVSETATRDETTTPSIDLLDFPAMELYAMPSATQTLLDDSFVNLEAWLADEVTVEFAEEEGLAFTNGDGVGKPRGILQYTKVADASFVNAVNTTGFIKTLGAAGFAASTPSNAVVNLVYALKGVYRQNAMFMMNRNVLAEFRKLRDGQGNFLWQPNSQLGQPSTLMSYGVSENDDMPDFAANSFSVAFGDFRRGYIIIDRAGVRILRDPYTAKPYVRFYTTKRVGGGVQNFEAIKLLKCEA